jgi:hypothetical protein
VTGGAERPRLSGDTRILIGDSFAEHRPLRELKPEDVLMEKGL